MAANLAENIAALEKIKARAKADAAVFASEFPGQVLEGDWDSEAWAIARGDLPAAARSDLAWPVYQAALKAEIEELIKGAPRA